MSKKMEKLLKALASHKRLMILAFLIREKSASVGEIAEEIGISIKSTSKHLLQLYSAEFLERERKGGLTFYFLNDSMGKIERDFFSIIRKHF